MLSLFVVTSGKPFEQGMPFIVSGYLLDEFDAFRVNDWMKEIKALSPFMGIHDRVTGYDIIHGKRKFEKASISVRNELLHNMMAMTKKLELNIVFSAIRSIAAVSQIEIEQKATSEMLKRSLFAIRGWCDKSKIEGQEMGIRILLDSAQWNHSKPKGGVCTWIDDELEQYVKNLDIINLSRTNTALVDFNKFGFFELADLITYIFRLHLKDNLDKNGFATKLYYKYAEDKIYSGLRSDDSNAGIYLG